MQGNDRGQGWRPTPERDYSWWIVAGVVAFLIAEWLLQGDPEASCRDAMEADPEYGWMECDDAREDFYGQYR